MAAPWKRYILTGTTWWCPGSVLWSCLNFVNCTQSRTKLGQTFFVIRLKAFWGYDWQHINNNNNNNNNNSKRNNSNVTPHIPCRKILNVVVPQASLSDGYELYIRSHYYFRNFHIRQISSLSYSNSGFDLLLPFQLCLLAKCMKPVLPFLDVDITEISKEVINSSSYCFRIFSGRGAEGSAKILCKRYFNNFVTFIFSAIFS